jgi:hypothetical protein
MSGEAAAQDGRGIVQVIVASGDKATYTIGEREYVAVSDAAPNYVLLIADSESLVITAFDGEHGMLDQFTISNSEF